MSDGSFIWLVLFGLCGALFFGIALVVAIRGLGDLKDLLKSAKSPRSPE